MRWDNLSLTDDESRQLPGYREPAVVRRFDAPEAMDVRFYEVRARSALNRVPERSRSPFRWTLNPYRGCTHACVYCMSGDTPILMGDGRTKPLAHVRAGDEVYGTVRRGANRRYAIGRVLDHWSTVKPAYRITVEDGTELIVGGDHRFLTERGWKFATAAQHGAARRPHLTSNTTLMGIGALAERPALTPEYRLGYLCGMIRGDAHVGSYASTRTGGRSAEAHRFRPALVDLESIQRTREYLDDVGIAAREFEFAAATGTTRAVRAIRASSRAAADGVREVIRWPRRPGTDWCKGFLAGIFDAEGGRSGSIRLFTTHPEIIAWTTFCLRRLGFAHTVEQARRPTDVAAVRLQGDLREVMRFFHTVDPAITRKRRIEGTALKSDAGLRVLSVEPLGIELPLFDLTTETGDFIADGVVSHNCFARPTHTYLGLDAGRDFEREIIVKVNAPELLRAELARPRWQGEHVALGTNTDPYQWVEGRYRLMPGIWAALRDAANPCSVLTKSPLLLRDLPLFRELVGRTRFTACLSVPTLDEKAWRASEPHTPNPRARLEAVAELNRAGIPTGILIAPLMPGINDDPAQIEEILTRAEEAGATSVGGAALHVRGEVRDVFMAWLRDYRPDLVERYEALYARGAYVPAAERRRLTALTRGEGRRWRRAETATTPRRPPPPRLDPPAPLQPRLFGPGP